MTALHMFKMKPKLLISAKITRCNFMDNFTFVVKLPHNLVRNSILKQKCYAHVGRQSQTENHFWYNILFVSNYVYTKFLFLTYKYHAVIYIRCVLLMNCETRAMINIRMFSAARAVYVSFHMVNIVTHYSGLGLCSSHYFSVVALSLLYC